MSIPTTLSGHWTNYRLSQGGRDLATARWRAVDGLAAELHHEVLDARPGVLRKLRSLYCSMVRPDIRAAGCARIVVAGTPEQMVCGLARYLEFMGFDILPDPVEGKLLAMMEA